MIIEIIFTIICALILAFLLFKLKIKFDEKRNTKEKIIEKIKNQGTKFRDKQGNELKFLEEGKEINLEKQIKEQILSPPQPPLKPLNPKIEILPQTIKDEDDL